MAYANQNDKVAMSSRFNKASNGISRRASALLQRYGWSKYNRVMRAAMSMQNGLREKGLANSGG